MVRRGNDKIGYWHGPPYTKAEDDEFYRRAGGAKSLTIAKAPPAEREKAVAEAQRAAREKPKGSSDSK